MNVVTDFFESRKLLKLEEYERKLKNLVFLVFTIVLLYFPIFSS